MYTLYHKNALLKKTVGWGGWVRWGTSPELGWEQWISFRCEKTMGERYHRSSRSSTIALFRYGNVTFLQFRRKIYLPLFVLYNTIIFARSTIIFFYFSFWVRIVVTEPIVFFFGSVLVFYVEFIYGIIVVV